MELSLVQENGQPIPDGSEIAFVNNVLHSIIKKQDIYLNDKCINSSSDNHHYKQYIDTNIVYNSGAKTSILQSQGYYQDSSKAVSKIKN